MAKLYFKTSSEESRLVPSKETISFLLNYSSALRVMDCKAMKFETILN